jgi:hypothetical protein
LVCRFKRVGEEDNIIINNKNIRRIKNNIVDVDSYTMIKNIFNPIYSKSSFTLVKREFDPSEKK